MEIVNLAQFWSGLSLDVFGWARTVSLHLVRGVHEGPDVLMWVWSILAGRAMVVGWCLGRHSGLGPILVWAKPQHYRGGPHTVGLQ
jgi:hypothetical protein